MNARIQFLVAVAILVSATVLWFGARDAIESESPPAVDRVHAQSRPEMVSVRESDGESASAAGAELLDTSREGVTASGDASESAARPGTSDYMCVGSSLCDQKAVSDPRVAATPAEAYWMATRGFPTQAEIEYAAGASVAEIMQRAASTRSDALLMLGLEKEISLTSDATRLAEMMTELADRADRRRQSYAYYGLAAAKLRLWEISGSGDASRWAHMVGAATVLKKAVLLGDVKATALYATLPAEFLDAGVWAAADRDAMLQLQRSANDGRFVGVGEASPRPVAALTPALSPRG